MTDPQATTDLEQRVKDVAESIGAEASDAVSILLAFARQERQAGVNEGKVEAYRHAAQHCKTDACGIAKEGDEWKRAAEYFQYQVDHILLGPAWERNKDNREQARKEPHDHATANE